MRIVAVAFVVVAIAAGFGMAVRLGAAPPRPAVRPPAVAGQFYPADAGVLRTVLEAVMRDAVPARVAQPVAIVVPHAGYIYSAQVAADAYKQVAALAVDTVVILGTNHTSGTFRRVSVYDGDGYRTPLGVARVDRDLAALLVKDGGGVFDASLHTREHSVEVQVPFVQYLFPKAAIVPVVVGAPDPDSCRRFGRAIAALASSRRLLVVASSDLSHYPGQQVATEVDRRTLEAIAGMKLDAFAEMEARAAATASRGVETCACGEGPIRVAIETARAMGALRGTVVSYANSGDTVVGDPSRVVGYGAVVFGRGDAGADLGAIQPVAPDPKGVLDEADKRALLRLARETVTRFLRTETVPLPRGGSPKLLREAGVFVTLTKHGELRGCIGRIVPEGPLIRLTSAMAIEAALKDPRFQPVAASELTSLEFEISVLTPMAQVAGPDSITVGRDGVLLRLGERGAVFLPQVAPEQHWNRTQMLEHLAEKAGLPASAWRDKNARFFTFQADVFGEATLK